MMMTWAMTVMTIMIKKMMMDDDDQNNNHPNIHDFWRLICSWATKK